MNTFFTWIGIATSVCTTMLLALWIIDFTVRKVLRAVGWWGMFVRFMWLDGNKKRALREEHERAKRGGHQ
jgi:hypothetical protein